MRFYIVDVFAEQKYQGNQLAVLIPDQEISSAEMQQITHEIKFSETSFIVSDKQANGGYNVRIFTPDVEVPFAGHPSLGTAFIIQQMLEQGKSKHVILNLGVGQIPVAIAGDAGNELWMQQKEPSFAKNIAAKTIAEILQINEHDINNDFPIQIVSTGLPAVIIPLKTLAAVQKCIVNHEKYRAFLKETGAANLMIFTTETLNKNNDLYARVFVDDTGFFEDPATGSANGNLAAYLLEYNFLNKAKINLSVEQGYAVRRPSLIKIDAEKVNGKFSIRVGGKVFLIATGQWNR